MKPNAGSSQTSTKFTDLNKIDIEGEKRKLKLLKSGRKEETLLLIIQKKKIIRKYIYYIKTNLII